MQTVADTKSEMHAPRRFPFVNVVRQEFDDMSCSWVRNMQTLLHTLRKRLQLRELYRRVGRLIQREVDG